jgi:hypothetical protein
MEQRGRKGGRSGGALDGFSRRNRGEKGKEGAPGVVQRHAVGGGSRARCCVRSSKGRGSVPATAGPRGGR